MIAAARMPIACALMLAAFIATAQDKEGPANLVWTFELAGDRLTLTPRWTENGKQWNGIRVFERVK
jgi:hypothetical protein